MRTRSQNVLTFQTAVGRLMHVALFGPLLGLTLVFILMVQTSNGGTVAFSLDLGAAALADEGLGGEILDIRDVLFTGISHIHVDDTDGNGVASIGEFFVSDTLIVTTVLKSSTGFFNNVSSSGDRLNDVFEITARFSAPGVFVAPANSSNINFLHVAAGTNVSGISIPGTLEIFVDGTADANLDTGAGFIDGTMIARYQIVAGDGGVVSFPTGDGQDDIAMVLTFAAPDVISIDGEDVSGLIGLATAFTDANLDFGTFSMARPSDWPSFDPSEFDEAGTPTGFFAKVDGSLRMNVIPEPSSLVITLIGMLSFAWRHKRKRQSLGV